MKREVRFGLTASVPLFIIALAFLMTPKYFPEHILSLLKPIEYIAFISCVIGLPLLFQIRSRLTLAQLLLLIAVMWGTLSVSVVLVPYVLWGVLAHDKENSLGLAMGLLGTYFIIGFLGVSLICIPLGLAITAILKRITGKGLMTG